MNELKEKKDTWVTGMYVYQNQYDWKPFTLSVRIDQLIETLEKFKPKAKDGFIKLNIRSKYDDKTKWYAELNDYQPKQEVTSAQHSPNRQPVQVDDSGLPF